MAKCITQCERKRNIVCILAPSFGSAPKYNVLFLGICYTLPSGVMQMEVKISISDRIDSLLESPQKRKCVYVYLCQRGG